jgi:hypothetical protein
MVTATWLVCLPRAISWRYRLHRRTCAFQLPLLLGRLVSESGRLCHGDGPTDGAPAAEGANVGYAPPREGALRERP